MQNKTYKRKKMECGICKSLVYNMTRHLRNAHNFSVEDAKMHKKNASEVALEITRRAGGGKKRRFRPCPFPNCGSVVTRLDKHLWQKHQLKPGRNQYKAIKTISRRSALKVSGGAEVATPVETPVALIETPPALAPETET